ncbi:hypothetical protein BST61_g7602 [Cercospora zeina]
MPPTPQSDFQAATEALLKFSTSNSPPPTGDRFRWTPTTDRILLFFCAQRTITPADFDGVVQCIRDFHGVAPSFEQIRQRVKDFHFIREEGAR